MNKPIISLFAVLSLLTFSGSTVSAQTADYAPAGSPSPTTCTNLTTNLGWGTTSSDVTTLQNYLSLTGYMSVEATGYYGNVTSNAVSSYQTAHSIEGTGYVGPLTRTAIRNESCGTTASAGTAGTTIAAGSVVCPAGMTCTRATPAATPAVCPLGYVCQPQTGTASTVPTYVPRSIYTPGSAYTPGSLANSASGNQSAGLPAGSITAAQYQALLQSQGQAAGTTTPNAAGNTGVGAGANASGTTTPNATLSPVGGPVDFIYSNVSDPARTLAATTLPIAEGFFYDRSPNYFVPPYSSMSPDFSTNMFALQASGATVNRSNAVSTSTWSYDFNPSGQYYAFPCYTGGCIWTSPSHSNLVSVEKRLAAANACTNEVSFETARLLPNSSFLISTSTLHLKNAGKPVRSPATNFYGIVAFWPGESKWPDNPAVFDVCLDPGYVSNVPAGYDRTKILALNTPITQAIVIPAGRPTMSPSDYTITPYDVTVNYGKSSWGLDSNLIKKTGTQQVTVAIIKFHNIAKGSVVSTEIIYRLLSIGYRPAVSDEAFALQPIVGDGIHALGFMSGMVTSSRCPGTWCAQSASSDKAPNWTSVTTREVGGIFPNDLIAAVKL